MTGRVGTARRRTFRSLAQPNYRRFFVGNSASVIGTWMQRIGQDWLVLELTGSALALGGAMLCQFLPVLVGGVWGGVVVDRVDTRRLLIMTQASQGLLAVALAVVALTGAASLAAVYTLAALLGVVTIFDNPARHAFVAELVGPDDIVNAQALNSLIHNVGRLVGPAVGGLLIAAVGVGMTFVVNAVSFVAVLVSLVLMDVSALRPVTVSPRAPGQARAGLRYVWAEPHLRATLALVAVVSVFAQNFRVIFPVLATETFDGDATTYGWLTASLGLGAVVGALVSAGATTTTSWRLLWVCVTFAVTNLVVAGSPTLTMALAVVAVLGVTNILFNTMARTVLQLNTAPEMRGRVMAIYAMVFLGGLPVGGPLIGLVSELWGPRVGLVVSGGAVLVGCAVLWPRVRRLRDTGSGVVPVAEGQR